jgi:hypothetical protein
MHLFFWCELILLALLAPVFGRVKTPLVLGCLVFPLASISLFP